MFHTIQLSKSDPTPLYVQLASELGKLIQTGILPYGMKLPPIRQLSSQLSINRDTVVSAYKYLEHQGFVQGHIGKGTYVDFFKSSQDASLHSEIIPHISCSHLRVPTHFFPSSLCLELTKQTILAEGWEAFSDPLFRERHCLKQNVVSFFERFNIHTTSAEIRIFPQIDHLLRTLFRLSTSKAMCFETPRDLSISCYLQSLGATVYEIPLTSNGLDLDILEDYAKREDIGYVFIMPNFQNPTGICYDATSKAKLLALANQYDFYIVEDGTYSTFTYNTPPLPSIIECSASRVIYLYHFSKLYLPELSYTFVILPTSLLKLLNDDLVCTFNESLLRHYLNSAQLSSIQESLYDTCKYKYAQLSSYLLSKKEIIHSYTYSGGLWFWLKPLHMSTEIFLNELLIRNILVSPGSIYMTREQCDFIRLSIIELSSEDVSQVIAALEDILS